MIPQLPVIHETLATVVTFERLVVIRCVDAPNVLLHVRHLLSTEDTSRLLALVVGLHVRFHVDPALKYFSTNFTRSWCFGMGCIDVVPH